jgi:hypothetical protein
MSIAKGDSAKARELGLKGGGRPKGSVDKKWYNIQSHWEALCLLAGDDKEKQWNLRREILFKLLEKLQVIPATPEESVANVAQRELQEATLAVNRPDGRDLGAVGPEANPQVVSGSNQASLANGSAEVDVRRASAEIPKSMGSGSESKA